jgi:hypothetical protein
MTWVTDLSHFIDTTTGDLPRDIRGPARRLAEQMVAIVAAATASSNRGEARPSIRCRRRPGRRACHGVISYRLWPDERITWECGACGDNGVISNWQASMWDRRETRSVH